MSESPALGDATPDERAKRVYSLKWWQQALLTGTIVAGCCALAITSVYVWQQWQKWDPLGDYPLQRVNNTLPGFNTPAVMVGQEVVVEATKCIVDDKPVNITGKSHWTEVEPNGFTTPYSEGQSQRLPGCTRITYSNPMPREVVDRVTAQCRVSGVCHTTWRKEGVEVPVNKGGDEGQQRLWFTGNFIIVVPNG